ncbi:hypothetical protein Dimus_026562 [Dionaea muscipula]
MFGQSSSTGRNERSKKAKKPASNSNDKPKQPQRGLGVAQLERIRKQMAYGFFPPHHVPYPNQQQDDQMRMMQSASAPTMMQSSTPFGYPPQFSPSSYVYPPNTMGLGDMETANANYGESQPRWNPSCNIGVQQYQQYAQGGMSTRPLLGHAEDFTQQMRRSNYIEGMGSSSSRGQNSNPSERSHEELDLELRL